MPAWLLSALNMLRIGAIGTPTRALVTGAGAGLAIDDFGFLPSGLLGGGDDKPKRRRRRRALTASDRADIGFIAGLLGPKAGKDFATIIATRAR